MARRDRPGILLVALLPWACLAPWRAPSAPVAHDPLAAPRGRSSDRTSQRSTFAREYLLTLASGPFPRDHHPQALIHIPPAFDPREPINLVVFLHGWNNCVETVAGDVDAVCDPALDAAQGPRPAFGLISAMDRSRKNAILVVLQLAWDTSTGDDGTLASDGGFRRIAGEILADLPRPAGPRGLDGLGQIAIVSHSGAFVAAADILDRGGLDDHVSGVYLLDSLYAKESSFESWLDARFSGPARGGMPPAKFADIYLPGCGTDGLSQELASRLRGELGGGRSRAALVELDDPPGGALADGALASAVLFVSTGVDHDALPRRYFGPLVDSSLLPAGGSVQKR